MHLETLLCNDENADKMYSIFIGYLQYNIRNIIKITPDRIKQEPWITFGVLKSSQRLKKLYKKTLQATCIDNIRQNI